MAGYLKQKWVFFRSCLIVSLVLGLGSTSFSAYSATEGKDSSISNSSAETSATGSSPTRFSGAWQVSIGGRSYTEGLDKADAATFSIGADAVYRLNKWVKLSADGEAVFYSSQVQARFKESSDSNKIYLNEFVVEFKPLEFLTFQAGAVNQGFLQAPLLVNDRAFPGLRETFHIEALNMTITAQQTIPTSTSFNSNRSDLESTPTFFTETIETKWQLFPSMLVSAFITHYSFSNLPSVVAFDSGKLGNTTSGFLAPNSEFFYDFDGFVVGGEAVYKLNSTIAINFGGTFMENTKASTASNRGQLLEAGLRLKFSDIILKPRAELFFNESDTSPAKYNSGRYGHNNRKGESFSLRTEFPQWGFQLQARMTNSNLINSNAFQNDLTSYEVSLETIRATF